MARAHDCGPEPSLRTCLGGPPRRHPRPPAAPFGFPRAHQGCAPSARPRRRAGAVLVRCAAGSLFTGEICVARLTRPRGRPHSAYASAGRRGGGRLRAGGEVTFALRAARYAASPPARHCGSPQRPPARPAGGKPRKIFHCPRLGARTLRTALIPADVRLQAREHDAARPWGARGVDKPEGI